MRGLLLKDLYTMGFYKKNAVLFLGMIVVMSVLMGDASMYVTMMTMMYLMITTMQLYSMDERAKWDLIAVTMPAGRGAIVGARYLFLALAGLAVGLLGLAVSAVLVLFTGAGDWLGTALPGTAMMLMLFLVITSLVAPISYKLGTEKARMYVLLAFAVPYVITILAAPYWSAALEAMGAVPRWLLLAAGLLLCGGGYLLSWRISSRIYEKKEF